MQTDDKVVLVSREYNDGSIMVNKFDSIDQAIKFKDRWANLNESNIDYHTLETTALVSNVSEMIDLLDKYEKNTFALIRKKDGDPISPFPTDPSAPQLAQSAFTIG
jgi:hypothetical protein